MKSNYGESPRSNYEDEDNNPMLDIYRTLLDLLTPPRQNRSTFYKHELVQGHTYTIPYLSSRLGINESTVKNLFLRIIPGFEFYVKGTIPVFDLKNIESAKNFLRNRIDKADKIPGPEPKNSNPVLKKPPLPQELRIDKITYKIPRLVNAITFFSEFGFNTFTTNQISRILPNYTSAAITKIIQKLLELRILTRYGEWTGGSKGYTYKFLRDPTELIVQDIKPSKIKAGNKPNHSKEEK